MKYALKPGDRLRVISQERYDNLLKIQKCGRNPYIYGKVSSAVFIPEYTKFLGRTVTVHSISDFGILILEDNTSHYWAAECFEFDNPVFITKIGDSPVISYYGYALEIPKDALFDISLEAAKLALEE